jgi:hypothetical protein
LGFWLQSVLPAFGYEVTIIDSFAIGWVFTVISMLRSYFFVPLV